MKNKEVIADFFSNRESKTKHLFTEKNVLYSYGYHFPLCVRLTDGNIVNQNGYSNTTAKHKGLVSRELGFNSFKDLEQNHGKNIILLSTEKITKIIQLNLNSVSEILEREI